MLTVHLFPSPDRPLPVDATRCAVLCCAVQALEESMAELKKEHEKTVEAFKQASQGSMGDVQVRA